MDQTLATNGTTEYMYNDCIITVEYSDDCNVSAAIIVKSIANSEIVIDNAYVLSLRLDDSTVALWSNIALATLTSKQCNLADIPLSNPSALEGMQKLIVRWLDTITERFLRIRPVAQAFVDLGIKFVKCKHSYKKHWMVGHINTVDIDRVNNTFQSTIPKTSKVEGFIYGFNIANPIMISLTGSDISLKIGDRNISESDVITHRDNGVVPLAAQFTEACINLYLKSIVTNYDYACIMQNFNA